MLIDFTRFEKGFFVGMLATSRLGFSVHWVRVSDFKMLLPVCGVAADSGLVNSSEDTAMIGKSMTESAVRFILKSSE